MLASGCNKRLLRAFCGVVTMMAAGQESDAPARFDSWVREHGRAVRGYLLGVVRRPDVADDLTQDVFCRAWQARDGYREQGTARAYLLRIADRLACDWFRRRRPEQTLDQETWNQRGPAGPESDPAAEITLREAGAELKAALGRLSEPQRRVLLLRYYGQMSFAEIAQVMGCPLNTTLSHCHRGLEALRKLMVEKPR